MDPPEYRCCRGRGRQDGGRGGGGTKELEERRIPFPLRALTAVPPCPGGSAGVFRLVYSRAFVSLPFALVTVHVRTGVSRRSGASTFRRLRRPVSTRIFHYDAFLESTRRQMLRGIRIRLRGRLLRRCATADGVAMIKLSWNIRPARRTFDNIMGSQIRLLELFQSIDRAGSSGVVCLTIDEREFASVLHARARCMRPL